MASCTICGVSFGKSSQVRAHIQGSGGEHAGIGYNDAEQFISDARDESEESTDEPAGPASEPASSPSSTGGLGIPEKDVEPAPREQEDDPTCPECGSNRWFDASEHTDYPRACADCSDSESWVVYR